MDPGSPRSDRHRLYEHVRLLTSIRPYRNHKNIQSLRVAADHIEEQFQSAGLATGRQTWEARNNTYENVIASFQPEREHRLIVGAHYDVYKEQPGADDNASGVVGLLELGHMLQTHKGHIPYGIELVAFCLEEPPFFRTKQMGSYIHAKSMHEQGRAVLGMISLEMIGYFGDPRIPTDPGTHFLIVSGIERYMDFNRKVAGLLRRNKHMGARMVSFKDDHKNNGASDHRNYWQFGYPGVMLIGTDGYPNPHYHKPSDTFDTLHYSAFAQAVNSCWQVAARMGED